MKKICQTAVLLIATSLWGNIAEAKSQCDTFDIEVTKTPAPPLYSAAFRRHAIKSAQATAGADVVMLGDSITDSWPGDLLQNAFPGQKVVNYGMGGDRVQNALWRISNPPISIMPKKVYILLGTNNLSTDKPCAIAGGILNLIAEIRSMWHNPSIFVIDILPRGPDYLQFAAQRAEVAALLRDFMAQIGVKSVDLSEALACTGIQDCGKYQADNVHLTRDGYVAMTDSLAGYVSHEQR